MRSVTVVNWGIGRRNASGSEAPVALVGSMFARIEAGAFGHQVPIPRGQQAALAIADVRGGDDRVEPDVLLHLD